MKTGTIIKGIGSFYYILNEQGEVIRCKMRGSFRNKKIVPAVGDHVEYTVENQGDGVVESILPRKSYLSRPVVANATQGVIVSALKNPDISFIVLDKMLINNKLSGLKSIICFNKTDLVDKKEIDFIRRHYEKCGAQLLFTSGKTKQGLSELKDLLKGQISVFSGVSGAGKSTILGILCTEKIFESGELSEKIQRGKNTTRHSELCIMDNGAYIMDTPGFSDLDISLDPNELWKYYDDFYDYSVCKFNSCLHLKEPDCGIKKAVDNDFISRLRYDNYKAIYEELKKNYKEY